MASIEQSLETVLAVIIFIGLAFMLFKIFGSAECDKISNTTAIELTKAINKVALEKGVEPWAGDGVPPDEETDNYVAVSVRLCEKNRVNSLLAPLMAQSPTYILTFETFPEAGYAWSESQPYSGGAAESALNYALMKYGMKAFSYAGRAVKLAKNLLTKTAKGVWSAASGGGKALLGLKLQRWWEKAKQNRVIRWIYNRFKSSSAKKTLPEQLDDRINENYYPNKWKDTVNKIKDWIKKGSLDDGEALVREGAIEGEIDKLTNTYVPILDSNGRYIVTPEYREFMSLWIENSGDAAEDLRKAYYIPSRTILGWDLEKFKTQKWLPFKETVKSWWNRRWLKQAIDKTKDVYYRIKNWYSGIKGGFNEYFNYDETKVTGVYDLPQEIGKNKEYMLSNLGLVKNEVKDNFDKIRGPLQSITGKIFASADDVADEDIIKLINNYDRYFNSKFLISYALREQEELSGIASKALGKEIFDEAQKVKNAADKLYQYGKFQESMIKSFDSLPASKQLEWVKKFSSGFSKDIELDKAREVYEYARTSMLGKGILDTSKFNAKGVNWLVKKADIVKSDMIGASIMFQKKYSLGYKITDVILAPVLTESSFESLQKKTLTYVWQRGKRFVYLDSNRVGQGVLAPYNFIPSSYSLKEALAKESEIKEGGCAENSICRIVRAGVSGPTETASAYLLDRDFPKDVEVKLWRPKPELTARTPIGINTALFYNSIWSNPRFYVVSPCFGIAKVWYSKNQREENTVFVKIEKEKKCNVNCSQSIVTTPDLTLWERTQIIPGVFAIPGVTIPSQTIGFSSIDTPNYCYADEEFIWGENPYDKWAGDYPAEWQYYPGYAACVGICTSVAQAGFKACLKGCGYAAIGWLMADTALATQAYRDVPSWKRQETGWGYWNYQKAEDICDTIDMISSMGSFAKPTKTVQALPGIPGVPAGSAGLKASVVLDTSKAQKILSTAGQKIQKAAKYTTFGVGDICYSILLIGDTALSWPIKTPSVPPWEIFRKGATLDEECMKESAANCAWLKKCEISDPEPCPEGTECIDNVCKISGAT